MPRKANKRPIQIMKYLRACRAALIKFERFRFKDDDFVNTSSAHRNRSIFERRTFAIETAVITAGSVELLSGSRRTGSESVRLSASQTSCESPLAA